MNPTPVVTDDDMKPGENQNAVTTDVPIERTSGERWLSRVLLMLVGMVLVAAMAQTVGHDFILAIRRLPAVRRISAPTFAPPELPVASSASSDDIVLAPKRVPGADAQIVPPRRRQPLAASNETVEEIADGRKTDIDLAGLVDALNVSNRELQGEIPPDSGPSPLPNTDDTNDLTNTLLATSAQLVSLSWQDFAYPADWSSPATSKPRMFYNGHRNQLLKAIAHSRPSALSLAQARKEYEAARALFGLDPRLDYAFGLVLWKHEQFAEAIDVFQSAARLEETPFLPAALAVAWGRFLVHEERRGLDQLTHVARLLGSSRGDYPTAEQREQAAILMGRAIGYLVDSAYNSDLAEVIELTSRNIEERLPPTLLAAFESGRQQYSMRQSELLQLTVVPQDQIEADHQRQTGDLQSRIDSLRVEMRDARNLESRAHLSHVETIKEILTDVLDVRAQTEKMQPLIGRLREAVEKNSRSKPRVDVKTMPGHYELVQVGPYDQRLVRRTTTWATLLQETASDRASRISQLNKSRDELKKIDSELVELRDEQQALIAERRAAELQYHAESNDARLARVARLQQQRELESKLQALNKALRLAMTLREGVDTIAAYVPWNVEIEGEALWWALNSRSANRSK